MENNLPKNQNAANDRQATAAKPEPPANLPLADDEPEPAAIFELEQEAPEIISPADKEEAALWEAISLSPRDTLPLHKRRETNYPAKFPSPLLEDAFRQHHEKTLKIFSAAAPKEILSLPEPSFFLKIYNKLIAYYHLLGLKRREKTKHNIEMILAYARQKRKITREDVKNLVGAKDTLATEYLQLLEKQSQLVGHGSGSDRIYKPAKY